MSIDDVRGSQLKIVCIRIIRPSNLCFGNEAEKYVFRPKVQACMLTFEEFPSSGISKQRYLLSHAAPLKSCITS